MAKAIEQSLEWCPNCNKKTIHYKQGKKINWLMHIALMFLGGIGFITLAFAIIGKGLTTPIGGSGKKTCSQCGFEH